MRCCISQDSDPPPAPEAVQESNDGSKDLQQEGSRLSMPQLGGFTSICWQQFCLRSAAYRDNKNFARWCHNKGRIQLAQLSKVCVFPHWKVIRAAPEGARIATKGCEVRLMYEAHRNICNIHCRLAVCVRGAYQRRTADGLTLEKSTFFLGMLQPQSAKDCLLHSRRLCAGHDASWLCHRRGWYGCWREATYSCTVAAWLWKEGQKAQDSPKAALSEARSVGG